MARNKGEGWLRVKKYADGDTVLFCFQTLRHSDGKRVENHKVVGLLSEFPTERSQWMEVARLGYTSLLDRPIGSIPTFGELAEHYRKYELKKESGIGKKAGETVEVAEINLDNWILPRWGSIAAMDIKPLEIEQWFDVLTSTSQGKKGKPLAWTSIVKYRSLMSLVYKHGIRHGLLEIGLDEIPTRVARCKTTSSYEAKVVTPEQMILILSELDKPATKCEWMLALLHAATALRPEEAFGLKWGDVDWLKGQINIRRGWSKGKETPGKNEGSMTQVPMHPAMAECLQGWRRETLYHADGNWIFPSIKEKGRIPRVASCCSQDHLRPAAVLAGVITADFAGRFGWHNLRHSLATFLATNVDIKMAQTILRHKKLATTAEIYAHAVQQNQIAAQGQYLEAIRIRTASQ